MKTFEQPLSAKEETEYLEEMNGEDLEAAHKARQILIERNLRLVAHVSKKSNLTQKRQAKCLSFLTKTP